MNERKKESHLDLQITLKPRYTELENTKERKKEEPTRIMRRKLVVRHLSRRASLRIVYKLLRFVGSPDFYDLFFFFFLSLFSFYHFILPAVFRRRK